MADWLRLLSDLAHLLRDLFVGLLPFLPIGLWAAFWLWAVNWKKAWPVLASGGWAPAVLILLVSAGVWARLAPGPCTCLRFATIPTFWWHLGAVGALAAVALFCGWLQGYMGWTPFEYAVEPPAEEHHVHAADHGQH